MLIDPGISQIGRAALWVLQKADLSKLNKPPRTLIVTLRKKGNHFEIEKMKVEG